jgi:hypothetical protein
MKFGLEQQGHIPTIERMASEWGKGALHSLPFWEKIGKEIGWDGFSACAWYCEYLNKQANPKPRVSEFQVNTFLRKEGWVQGVSSERFAYYKPPVLMGFDANYHLPVPKKDDAPDFEQALSFCVDCICGIYEKPREELFK